LSYGYWHTAEEKLIIILPILGVINFIAAPFTILVFIESEVDPEPQTYTVLGFLKTCRNALARREELKLKYFMIFTHNTIGIIA